MDNIFDGFHYNPMQKLKIFGILTYFNNKVEKEKSHISIEDISKRMKSQNIEISNKNIYKILKKYNNKNQFQKLFHSLNFDMKE